MEGRDQMIALFHKDRISIILGQHANLRAGAADDRRPNEHRMHRAVQALEVDVTLE